MGNQLTSGVLPRGVDDLAALLVEIPSFVPGSTLGQGKILKTLSCTHDDGKVIVKIYPKRIGTGTTSNSNTNSNLNLSSSSSSPSSQDANDLRIYERRLEDIRDRISIVSGPNIHPITKWFDGEKAIFLFRQYFANNVYDRFHTHPFLTDIEKKWLCFQLLEGLRQLHSHGLKHGDLKTENLLLTTWNWLFLSDICFFKPTYLPADNPADYAFYYETTRRRCYLAPERFYTHGERDKTLAAAYAALATTNNSTTTTNTSATASSTLPLPSSSIVHPSPSLQSISAAAAVSAASLPPSSSYPAAQFSNFDASMVTESMDIFSAGCCIAEIFLEGEALFDLPQLLSYREGVFDPIPFLHGKISDSDIRDLIIHMIQLNPVNRLSAKGYLTAWTPKSFPPSFSYLHKNVFTKMLSPDVLSSPDSKLQWIKNNERSIIKDVTGIDPIHLMNRGRTGNEKQREREKDRLKQKERDKERDNQREKQQQEESRMVLLGKPTDQDERKEIAPSSQSPSAPSGLSASLASRGVIPTHPMLNELNAFAASIQNQAAQSQLKDWDTLKKDAIAYKPPQFSTLLPVPALPPITPTSTPSATMSHSPSNSPLWHPSSVSSTSASSVSSTSFRSQHFLDSPIPLPRSPAPVDGQTNITNNSADLLNVHTDDNNANQTATVATVKEPTITVTEESNVLTMIVTLVCTCIQNVQSPQKKLIALDLMYQFGRYVEDEVRLGRLLPYCIALLADSSPIVRSMSVRTLTKLVAMVNTFQQSDAHIFPEYIFPALSRFPHDAEELVRLAYASNITTLAETSKKFLDLAQYMQQQNTRGSQQLPTAGSLSLSPSPTQDSLSILASPSAIASATSSITSPPILSSTSQSSYDAELSSLQDLVLKLVIDMLTVGGSQVKRALLVDITRVCMFMGRKRVNNELLPHLITVLNDRDWQLRVAFFDHIVGVSVFVGRVAFQNFVLPCVEQSLFDVEESVIQRAVHALTELCQLGLFEKRIMLEIVDKVDPLLCHPSAWIRNETISFILAMSYTLGLAKTHCFLLPALQPFLKQPIVQFTRSTLLPALKSPLTREEFNSKVYPKSATSNSSASYNNAAGANNGSYDGGSGIQRDPSFISQHGQQSDADDGADDDQSVGTVATTSSSLTSNGSSVSMISSGASFSSFDSSSSSSWLNDPDLKPIMLKYLNKVSQQVATKSSYSAAGDGSGEADEELESYSSIDEEAPVFEVEVERTTVDSVISSLSPTPTDRVQQALLDSLGVQVQHGGSASMNVNQQHQYHHQHHPHRMADSRVVGGQNRRREPIHQSLNKVPIYIQKALKIPPPQPSLGQLRESTITHSAFYQNHHQLEGYQDSNDPRQWRPRGVLVATLTEHTATVNCLSVSRDNVFLASGSDDGTVKIWDCNRLKLTANARSQLTHPQPGKVTAVTVCDSSHSIVSASDSGIVSVVKVEYIVADDGQQKYAGLTEVKKIDIRTEGSVLAVEHYNTLTESLLVYATQRGNIHSWDLRAKREPFHLSIEPAMGLLSCIVIGPTPYCLIGGTTRGFIIVWDLRFLLPIQVWRHHQKSKILSLTPLDTPHILAREIHQRYQTPNKGPLVFASAEGSNSIAAFDLLTGECRMVMRVQTPSAKATPAALQQQSSVSATIAAAQQQQQHVPIKSSINPNPPANVNLVSSISSWQLKQKIAVSPLSLPSLRSYLRPDYPASLLDDTFIKELQSLTETVSASLLSSSPVSLTSFLCCPQSFCLTAGTDRILRYWDLKEPIDSYRINQPDIPDAMQTRYTGKLENSTIVMEEVIQPANALYLEDEQKATSYSTGSSTALGSIAVPGVGLIPAISHDKLKLALSKQSRGQTPPSSCHQSEIVAMKAIEFPQKMLATASTDGQIKIWI